MRLTTLILACVSLFAVTPVAAQDPFSARVTVDDRIITEYEVRQRARFLEVLNTTGDLEQQAIDALIEDRLRLAAAQRMGISADEQNIRDGMEEFASRAEMSAEEFISALGGEGVEPQTFRDFVRAGIVWRQVVRQRFSNKVQISDAAVDRALSLSSQRGTLRVLLSEIFLPTVPQYAEQSRELAPRIADIQGIEAFADAARRFSAAPSAERGGRLEWMALSELPEQISSQIRGLEPGEVTEPIALSNAIAIFQLRAMETADTIAPSNVSVEYMRFRIPGGRSDDALAQAGRIRGRVDTCNDLYAEAQGLPRERLSVDEQPLAEVPQRIALELAKLDANEVSTALTEGESLVFLMLCSRTPRTEEPPDRQEVARRLVDQRLSTLADGYLAELRADARIRYP